jgi:DNA gyrase subunit A
MAVIRHFEAAPAERLSYLKMSRAVRGEAEEAENGSEAEELADANGGAELSQERYAEMSAAEEFLLTVSERGFGKRTSSFEYRVTGRGGKGIVAMIVNERNGKLIASFPAEDGDQIMLVSDGGQVIRVPVDGIRIVGRASQGVTIFTTADDERVVSVEHLAEPESEIDEGTEQEEDQEE